MRNAHEYQHTYHHIRCSSLVNAFRELVDTELNDYNNRYCIVPESYHVNPVTMDVSSNTTERTMHFRIVGDQICQFATRNVKAIAKETYPISSISSKRLLYDAIIQKLTTMAGFHLFERVTHIDDCACRKLIKNNASLFPASAAIARAYHETSEFATARRLLYLIDCYKIATEMGNECRCPVMPQRTST